MDQSELGELELTFLGCEEHACSFALAGRGALSTIERAYSRRCDELGLEDPFALEALVLEARMPLTTEAILWPPTIEGGIVLRQRTRTDALAGLTVTRTLTAVPGEAGSAVWHLTVVDRAEEVDVHTDEEAAALAHLAASEQSGDLWLEEGVGLVRFAMRGGGHERSFTLRR